MVRREMILKKLAPAELREVVRTAVGELIAEVLGPQQEEAAITLLRSRGYTVALPRDWETPTDFCRRIGIVPQTFSRLVRHPDRPDLEIDWGAMKKRVLRLSSNPAFEDFC